MRAQVAEAITKEVAGLEFPDRQDYRDIADDLSQALIRPMFKSITTEHDDYTERMNDYLTDWTTELLDFDPRFQHINDPATMADQVKMASERAAAYVDEYHNGDQAEALQPNYKDHGMSRKAEQRLVQFANQFDPAYESRNYMTYEVLRAGGGPLVFEDNETRNIIAEDIIDGIASFNFQDRQDYQDIAEDLTKVLTEPMFEVFDTKWQESEEARTYVENIQSSMDFLSDHSNRDEKVALLQESLNGLAKYISDDRKQINNERRDSAE